jgi:nucleoside-diphosphate-sugar epimerase
VRVLVTGSSGFSGSRLALYLAQRKEIEQVVGVDCAKPQVFHPKLTSHVLDLTDWSTFAPIRSEDVRPDVVIHTAADQASPYLLFANSVAMKNLLDYCGDKEVERMVFFSSFYASMRCSNYYRYGKLDSEHELRRSGLRYIILRPDTIYGHGEPKYDTLMGTLRKHFVPVIGNGRYMRTPCYIWDLALATERILAGDSYPCDIFEMGSPTAYTMNEMIGLMARELGIKRYVRVPLPPVMFKVLFSVTRSADADQMNTLGEDRVADSTRFCETFDMQLIDFEEGVSYLCKGDDRWPL